MARTIEGNRPETFDDALYLLDRGRLPQDIASKIRTHTRDAAVNDLMDLFGEEPEGTEDLPDDYNDWNVQNLKDELDRRGLETDGKKADLVERLEEDDEEVIG